jgi:hypothetical protein
MAAPVQTPEAIALDECAAPTINGARTSRPRTDATADLEAEIGAEHVARMGEIEHAHHAEDGVRPLAIMKSSMP